MIITEQTVVSLRCTIDGVVQPKLIVASQTVDDAQDEAVAHLAEGNEGAVIRIVETDILYEPPRE